MSDKDESFAQRWSRLKQQARAPEKLEEAPAPELPATLDPAGEPPPAGEKPEEEKPFDPASLPPVESLTKDSDYSLFMRPEVPEDLRQKALRRLWAADPVLSAPDPLDMHNIDYNAVPTFPEGVKTLFRIGQGMFDEAEAKVADEDAASRPPEGTVADEATAPDPSPDAAAQQRDLSKVKDSGPDKT
jgi:Protein of unknown function (DUF3306)